jgi:hypothetical protein
MDLETARLGNDASGKGATDLLRADHAAVAALFAAYREVLEGERAATRRIALGHEICMQIELHGAAEREQFYPAISEADVDAVDAAMSAHDDVDECIFVLRGLETVDPEYDNTMLRLMDLVEAHVAEEEEKLFPKVEAHFTQDELEALAEEMALTKESLVGAADELEARS